MKRSPACYFAATGVRLVLRFLTIPLISLSSCADKDRENPIPEYDLQGIVRDEFGEPMDSVTCVLTTQDQGRQTTTDKYGAFWMRKLKAGKYTITFSKPNYITGNEEIDVAQDPTVVELTLSAGTSFLRTSDSLFTVGSSSASAEVRVESNVSWTATSDAQWINISTAAGAGNSNLKITWEQSDEMTDRVGAVWIRSGSLQRKIKVAQAAPVKLMSYQGIIGNYENGADDSIRLVFNKPVSVHSITTSYYFCLTDIKHNLSGNTLSFDYSCARLGESYPFTVTAKDKHQTFTFDIKVSFYDRKTTIPGYIVDYFVTDDNKFIWGVTQFPNKVIKVSLPELTVVKTFDLDFDPNFIKWNAFRQSLNIFKRASRCDFEKLIAGQCDNNLIHFDPETGAVIRSKINLITGYDAGDSGYPFVFPYDLLLFEDGTGIIQLENEYNYFGWRFIDSRKSDSTYVSDPHWRHDIGYESIHMSHSKDKVYFMHQWGSTSVEIFNKTDLSFSTYTSPVSGRSNSLVVNKKNNRVYHAQLYEQFISDMGDYVSKISYIDNRPFYGGIDFSYKDGEEETLYFLQDGILQILDYKTAFTSFSCKTAGTLADIQSTTDGENFVALKKNNEGTTDLYVFNIDHVTENKAQNINAGGRTSTGFDKPFPSSWQRK